MSSAGSIPHPPGARRRPRIFRWVFLALLIVPTVEIAAIIAVGRVIGTWPTVALLVAESLLGAWLVRREGRRTWRALAQSLQTGVPPSKELADAALVLVGGTLLLTPGFVTDLVGFFFILPITRPITRRLLEAVVARRLLAVTLVNTPNGTGFRGANPTVVQGEVVDPPPGS